MAEKMEFTALMGHACGMHFHAAQHLKEHPEFNWEKDVLRNLDAHEWTTFQAARQ
jgi:hypothetical protein